MTLWNTGRFDDIRLETEPGRNGIIVRFVVTERRVIRSIKYAGAKTVTVSEILDRFKERKVGLSVESQYDPNKVQRAAVVLKEFLAERGRQYRHRRTRRSSRFRPPRSKVTFNVNEGPKVKVGHITIIGNKAFSDDAGSSAAMKNLHPIGIPHSIVFENIFAKTYDQRQAGRGQGAHPRGLSAKPDISRPRLWKTTVNIRARAAAQAGACRSSRCNKPGIVADITLPVEEGKLYHLHEMNFVGVKLFRTPEVLMQPLFGMGAGDVFSTDKLRKGLENMRKIYGEFGYIDFVPEPQFDIHPGHRTRSI